MQKNKPYTTTASALPSISLGKTKGSGYKTDVNLLLKMANRHGLITGATGTGKTVTLQLLAEHFSKAGVPVFTADVKGDLTGISQAGSSNQKILNRVKILGSSEPVYSASPVIPWDLKGVNGHPLRATLSEMGPVLIGRLFELNDVQQGVLQIAFKYADDNGLLLIDSKDLRALLQTLTEKSKEIQSKYGNVAPSSIGAIQRDLLTIESAGGDDFSSEPALALSDLMRVRSDGSGYISILDATTLIENPILYSTFLLWLLSELFEQLPEVGDLEKPKLVFFFDEAHLLFNNSPKPLLDKVEQVVRLIRSRGVGIYFVTQNPLDVPDNILGQLGNRVQHALRAFTPRDQRAVQTAADTFRQNPDIDTSKVITELGVGEALVSVLDEKGTPSIVEQVLIYPPGSQIGAIDGAARQALINESPLRGVYDTLNDRESAYEVLNKRAKGKTSDADDDSEDQDDDSEKKSSSSSGSKRQGFIEAFVKSAVRSFGSQIGRQILRGVLGSITKGR